MFKKGLLIFGGIAVLIGIIMFFSYTSACNTEMTMRKQVEAEQDVCKANFDKMFKTISQLAQVPEQFMDKSKEAFKEIYIPIMEGRYSKGDGSLMKWITESNPQFDLNAFAKLYDKLAIAIEANREEYFQEQKKLIDLHREHSTFINTWWNKNVWGLAKLGDVKITIVTSKTTKDAYNTGEENDIEIFKK